MTSFSTQMQQSGCITNTRPASRLWTITRTCPPLTSRTIVSSTTCSKSDSRATITNGERCAPMESPNAPAPATRQPTKNSWPGHAPFPSPCEIPTVIIVSYGRAPESCSFASCHNLLPFGPGTKHLTAKVAKGREGRRENRFGDLLCGFEYFVGFAVKGSLPWGFPRRGPDGCVLSE